MKYLITMFLSFIVVFSIAQKDYSILLSNERISLPNNGILEWKTLQNTPQIFFNNRAYVLLQLTKIPSSEEKIKLQQQGIDLLHYIPHYAWVASIHKNTPSSRLQQTNIRAISAFLPSWKMPTDLLNARIPSHAGDIDLLSVRILFLEKNPSIDYAALCEQAGLVVENSSSKWSWVEVNTSWKKLMKFAKHPLVQYIEFYTHPQEDEFLNEVTLIQSNYLSSNPSQGLFFNGSGVDIAVNEGGIIDSAHAPNFKGRLDRTLESGTPSGHKTGVGRRMASAGNLDPSYRGTAFGANLHSGGINFSNAASNGIAIVNNSFGWGCIGLGTTSTYNSGAANNDNLVRTNPSFMITYSAGNMGSSDCGYGNGSAGAGWANITGLTKSGKNIFAVGSLNAAGDLTGFSSRGPAWDGRILPDICATGPGGTSHASPNLAGVFAQLTQAYKTHNAGISPKSGLIKAILMNTADDLLNPGPDFKSGYGKINARKAYTTIAQNQFITATVSQGGSNTHNIVVPTNVKEVRVMVYWTDYEAAAGITSRALVNDLDIHLTDPSNNQWQPWVLNPTPDSTLLESFAIRTRDSLNNVEQVSLSNPNSGTYTLQVDGFTVPQGPQEYFVVYEFIYDELIVTYPLGGEQFIPNSTERIRWDSQGDTAAFDLSYSLDNGNSWSSIATGLASTDRFYDWIVPDTFSSTALIRVERGSTIGISDTNFHILAQPQNLSIIWSCSDSSLLYWDSIPNADGYIVYKLGAQHMDSIAYSTTNRLIVHNLSLSNSDFLAIAAVKNNAISKRTIAIEHLPNNYNCTPYDIGLTNIISPSARVLPSCSSTNNFAIEVNVRNFGVNTLTAIPLAYRIDGQTPILDTIFTYLPTGSEEIVTLNTTTNFSIGDHSLEIWAQYPNDGNLANDSLSDSLTIYNSVPASLPLITSFDAFTTCSTAWGCEADTCNLSQGWYNLTNTIGDAIDWRTDANGTGTGGTGPSGDHTSGAGNYLYLEGSGNNGSGCTYKEAILHSPCIDLTNANQPNASFWYHAHGSGIGSLHFDVIADGHLYQDVIPSIDGEQGNQWDSLYVDLSPFVNQKVVLAFRGYTGGGYRSDLAIDDINIATQYITPSNDILSQESAKINIYPNPTNGILSIDLEKVQPATTVYISNALGQTIHKSLHQTKRYLDVNINGPTGIYFVTIKNKHQKAVSFKVIKSL